ncbi:MAG: hypothetical protein WBG46_09625 [Nonlabens sp.]
MKKIILLSFAVIFLSCKDDSSKETPADLDKSTIAIVDIADFKNDLEMDRPENLSNIDKEIDSLKNVVEAKPYNVIDLARIANLLDKRFDLLADVEDLNESVRFRESVVKNTAIKPENAKRALAQAYIKQHRFKDADSLIKSFTLDYASRESKYVQFDIAMEVGRYEEAEKLLDELKNESDYNYLIRSAKWNDYIGRLDNTIIAMEKAKELAESSGRSSWKLWTYSNIADYYGHDGQIQKSYDHYLKTLELDPGNDYALKGISWVAFSHDKDPETALKIIDTLFKRHPSPDYLLSKAEIVEYLNNSEKAADLQNEFITKVDQQKYGAMYNAYLIEELSHGNENQKKKALEIARKEIKNRATPEIYDLLGYAMLKNGMEKEALENHQNFVIGKTYEPVAQMHTAEILRVNGQDEKADELKKELLEADYELGPIVMKEVREI